MPAYNEKIDICLIDNAFLLTKYSQEGQIIYRSASELDFDATIDLDTPLGCYDTSLVKAFQKLIFRISEAFGIDSACESSGLDLSVSLKSKQIGIESLEIN